MLTLQNIHAGYGGNEVLHGVSLEVRPGEVVALIGPNGAGKSTVLRSIFQLAQIKKGEIAFKDRNITHLHTHDLLELGIGFVPQGRLVFSNLTVEENLRMGGYLLNHKETLEKNMESVFARFPALKDKRGERARNLSGGQQQMLALGRALMMTPQILMLDEPSLGLSPIVMKEIYTELKRLNEQGTTLLIVEQNVHLALGIADRVYLLAAGEIRHHGPPEDFKDAEKMREMFLGK